MIEPQNDEERNALRLCKVLYDAECIDDEDIRQFMAVLSESRSIFREEQAKKAENPRSSAKEDELRAVRDEIRLRSEVLRAFSEDIGPTTIGGVEAGKQSSRFVALLRRERELMGDQWQT